MASHSREQSKSESESESESESKSEESYADTAWKSVRDWAEQERRAKAEKKAKWTSEWETLTVEQQRTLVAEKLEENWDLRRLGLGKAGAREDENSYTRRRRVVGEAEYRLGHGGGYKDVKLIRKAIGYWPDNREELEFLMGRVCEVDSHGGMTPKEYEREAERKRCEEAGEEYHQKFLERIGEKLLRSKKKGKHE